MPLPGFRLFITLQYLKSLFLPAFGQESRWIITLLKRQIKEKIWTNSVLKYSANGGLWRNGQIRVLNDLIFLLVTVLSRLKAVFFY